MPAKHQPVTIDQLFKEVKFTPNESQRAAILHEEGPLFLTAGPGSGKTRVLLWRTVNLIVCRGVDPERIFLSTFTEKAAHQLREGLRYLLAIATSRTGRHYDISGMAVGTVHSICRQILSDSRFHPPGFRPEPVVLLDELAQYFQIWRDAWPEIVAGMGFEVAEEAQRFLSNTVEDKDNGSKHLGVLAAIKAFNRFSEESILPERDLPCDEDWQRVRQGYEAYLRWLRSGSVRKVDLSLLQQEAVSVLRRTPGTEQYFEHVIVDEYQDTNSIQEDLFFHIARGHRNLAVVGDDDQALYRFRGATVENLVEFEPRCGERLGVDPRRIDLNINYRSRSHIVELYGRFIDKVDWRRPGGGHFRIMDKNIQAHRRMDHPAVVKTDYLEADESCAQLAIFIRRLKEEGKINDYNEVAVLFPSVKPYQGTPNPHVLRLKQALEENGVEVYAPRAGRFLEVEEAKVVMGFIRMIIGVPEPPDWNSVGYQQFRFWLSDCRKAAEPFVDSDPLIKQFIADRKAEVDRAIADLEALERFMARKKWATGEDATPERIAELAKAPGISPGAKSSLRSTHLSKLVSARLKQGRPLALGYALTRATTLDWNVLDLFYRLCAFQPFLDWFKLAEDGTDEAPVCNLAYLTEFLNRFLEEYTPLVRAGHLRNKGYANSFFRSFCYALWRLGESEYEDDDDPFPKGRVPFLTIHQSKGLEFRVVVLGSMGKREWPAGPLEQAVRTMLEREGGEPLERMPEFDAMRLFYVALSRAKDLLVLPEKKNGRVYPPLKVFRELDIPTIPEFDIGVLPDAEPEQPDLGRSYSFTGAFLS
ncbi:MAG: ATP-dependent helicase, partial [Flavobacteriales bacterium]|nr:ATP-dependent helicase [Flavobacteriales bacterium]